MNQFKQRKISTEDGAGGLFIIVPEDTQGSSFLEYASTQGAKLQLVGRHLKKDFNFLSSAYICLGLSKPDIDAIIADWETED